MAKVELKLQCDDKRPAEVWVLVRLHSINREGLWGELKVDADSPRLEYDVRRAAVQIAEFQNSHYGDPHDPATVSQAAKEALEDLKRQGKAARRKRGLG